MAALRVENIIKKFNNEIILNRVQLDVKENEIVALLGESGSGKSTLLRIIAGFETPDDGKVELNAKTLVDNNTFVKPEQRNVGLIFQDYALFPHLTVKENILFGIKKLDKSQQKQKLESLLHVFELKEVENKKPSRISGGQQQRVSIARALAVNPDLLLLDEPFSNLDQTLRQKVRKEIIKVKTEFKTPMLLVTHDPEDALQLADRVAVLYQGEIIQFDTPENIYIYPSNLYVGRLFGECNSLDSMLFRPNQVDFSKSKYKGEIVDVAFSARGFLIDIKIGNNHIKALINSIDNLKINDEISFDINN